MAYISFQPKDHFNTKLYTGNATDDTAITGVGFTPSFLWGKNRTDSTNHYLIDAVRGITKNIKSQSSAGEATDTAVLKSFDSDGFTLGNGSLNQSAKNFVTWNWKANGQGSSNTDGSINTTYTSANTTSGFSISTYTGTGSNATIGHGLGVAPKVVIIKNITRAEDWLVGHNSIGFTKFLSLNLTNAEQTSSNKFNDTAPTNQVFSVGTSDGSNKSGDSHVAYCFAEKKGFSKFGSYTGNGNADGAFIYTGFKPAFIMLKNASTAQDWQIYTWDMQPFNEFCTTTAGRLKANTTDTQSTKTAFDMLSNGFKMRTNASDINASGNKIIYMAFAEAPLVSSNGVPAVAR